MNEKDNRALRFFTYVAGGALITVIIVMIIVVVLVLGEKL